MPRVSRSRARLKRIASGQTRAAKPEARIPPTPETLRKLREDAIVRLVRKGQLLPHHQDAAMEIRSVHEAVGRGMFARSASFDPAAGRAPRRHTARDFTDRMSGRERRNWERHYIPWSHEMAVAVVAGMAGTRWLQLVTDIVVDNHAIRAVEDRYGLRHGTAIRYLVEALERYARYQWGLPEKSKSKAV